ncbi:MAG: 3-deoxy-D-manno-octulosonic acid transferase [Candidatus Omnitrophota bacterium]
MRFLYNIFFCVFAVFYVPVMAVKGKFHSGFSQKFARLPSEISDFKKPLWIHAVSVGEALVAARICEILKKEIPGLPVVISTTTPTGNEMIRKASKNVDGVFYYPVDLSWVVKRALDQIDPSAYVMVETELWPNMIEQASARGIPVILANGRISDRSFGRYKKIGYITKKIFGCFSAVCAQTQRDAEKMKALGCGEEKTRVTGNIKFDTSFSPAHDAEVERIGCIFTEGKKVIVAGSTHFPEESGIIDEFVKMRSSLSGGVKLIIAPRHIERKDAIRIYVEKAGLKCCFFSDFSGAGTTGSERADVMIVDTIGHLKDIYSLATVVFIGGSLVKKGGQNPIEAARWGKAVVFGTHMTNFREVADSFIESGAAVMAENLVCLGSVMKELLLDEEKRLALERKVKAVIEKNSGAVYKTVEVIKHCLAGEKKCTVEGTNCY